MRSKGANMEGGRRQHIPDGELGNLEPVLVSSTGAESLTALGDKQVWRLLTGVLLWPRVAIHFVGRL
jgi:hypothetical protein